MTICKEAFQLESTMGGVSAQIHHYKAGSSSLLTQDKIG